MKHINIKDFEITATKNNGINKEWSLCNYYGIERKIHDKTPYNIGSDIELDGMNISVKTPKASLMSGGFASVARLSKVFGGGSAKTLIPTLSLLSLTTAMFTL